MVLNGAEILLECLAEQGVDVVFGYPGGAVIHIYDALFQSDYGISHILTAHEQGAAHAADGYARATGKVGVCIATSGPGATNLVTGIATAYMDSIPMVAITGNVPVALLGKDSFQEVFITGITMPITKHNFIVRSVDELADTVRRAFDIARSGRPGPVLIDIPKDITAAKTNYEPKKLTLNMDVNRVSSMTLDQIAELINKARYPMIFSGGGVISGNASEEMLIFAETLNAPVACSLMGLGGFPTTHRLFAGMLGMHGSKASNQMSTECDLLIAVGARFSDRVISKVEGFAPNADILHIDIDPAEINKNVKTYRALIGPLKPLLIELNNRIIIKERNNWIHKLEFLKDANKSEYCDGDSLRPERVLDIINRLKPDDSIVVTEVGQNQMWTAQHGCFVKPRSFISSGGLGTMGFGLGAAIGAKMGMPDSKVILVAGDGSFHMNCNELSTAAKYGLNIVIVILNNGVLGMVRQWQNLFCGKRYSETTLNHKTDIVKLAEAFGASGYNLTRSSDAERILNEAFNLNGPVVVNCMIDIDDMVFPMVPPGAPIKEVLLKEEVYERE